MKRISTVFLNMKLPFNRKFIYSLSLLLGLFAGCANQPSSTESPSNEVAKTSSRSSNSLVIDIPQFLRKPHETFEKAFGKPLTIDVEDDPDRMPGEHREYRPEGAQPHILTLAGLSVRFFKDKSVDIFVDLPNSTTDAETALLRVGVKTGGEAPNIRALAADRWRDRVLDGAAYKEVAVIKNDYTNITTVQVEIDP
jgi:hypothetical protein